jgi:hypothetical protein
MMTKTETPPFRLDGEVALITGGATGLGFGMGCLRGSLFFAPLRFCPTSSFRD